MIGDAAELEGNLLGESSILVGRYFIASWRYIDQSADDAGFSVRNLHRLVSAHDEERLEPVGVSRSELLVDGHHLMGHQAVDAGVILNT